MNTNRAEYLAKHLFGWFMFAGMLTSSCVVQSKSNSPETVPPQVTPTISVANNERSKSQNNCKTPAELEAVKPSLESKPSELKRAVISKDIKALKRLLRQNADVEEKDEYERTVLTYAVSPAVVEVNLTPPNVAESAGKRQIRQQIMRWDEQAQIELTRELLKHGANPNQKDIYGETPVLRAAGFGNSAAHAVKLLTMLIEYHADVNSQDVRGRAALMEAARNGKPEVVKLLLEHGANAELTNCDGETALSIAQKYKYDDVIRVLQNVK